MAPIEGRITVSGSGNHPSATRVPWPTGTPGVDSPSKFAGEMAPAASPPAGARGLPAAPAQPAAESPELADLKARAATHAEEARVRRLERKVAAEARRAEIEARKTDLAQREARLEAVEKRLQSYKAAPHLALADLRSLGVEFQDLAQVVADGGASPEALARADAALAREEVQRLRAEVTERDRASRATAERERVAAQREAERQVVEDWKSNAGRVVEQAKEKYPLVARTLNRGSLDAVFEQADRIFTESRREPSFEEAIQATEERLQHEWAEIAGAGGGPPPPGRAAAPPTRESSGSPTQDRRRWFLEMLDSKLKGLR